MNVPFPQPEPESRGVAQEIQAPIGEYLGAAFDQGWHDSVLNSIMRVGEINALNADDSALLDPDVANKKYAVGSLNFTAPVKESVARAMNRRKKAEMDRQYFLSQGSVTRFLPGLAAQLLGNIANPVDLATMFVPFVGEERAAATVARAGGGLVRRALARGLIPIEAFEAARIPAPRFVAWSVQGAVNQSLFEVPNLIASAQDEADYGPVNAAFNIFTGGAFAGGIYAAGRLLRKLSPETKQAMTREALNNFLKDETVDVVKYVKLDENAIWAASRFNPGLYEAKALETLNMPEILKKIEAEHKVELRAALRDPVNGKIWAVDTPGKGHWETAIPDSRLSDETLPEIESGFVDQNGKYYTRDEAVELSGVPLAKGEELWSEHMADSPALSDAETATYNELKGAGLTHEEAMGKLKIARDERKLAVLREDPNFQRAVQNAVDQHVDDFVNKARAEYDQFGEFGRLRQAEIDRQIAEGKMMPDEKILEAQHSPDFDGTSDAKIDEQITSLKEELKVAEEGAKEQGMLDKMIAKVDAILKSVDEDSGKLMSDPFLLQTLGKPLLKGLLLAVREGLILTRDLTRAIDHAMEWLKKEGKDGPEIRAALEKSLTEEVQSPDFIYTIQAELNKPQPFNVRPERFTPQVVMSRIKNLPKPEQYMLERAGIQEFMAKYQPTEMIDREEFSKFVDSAMLEPEIRPMLNRPLEESPEALSRAFNKAGRYSPFEAQHILETAGWKFGENRQIIQEGKPLVGIDRHLPEQYKAWHDKFIKKKNLPAIDSSETLFGTYVSQNVSVPIPFEKMEKPRTIFLAADQDVHVGSSHYSNVFNSGMDRQMELRRDLQRGGYVFDPRSGEIIDRSGGDTAMRGMAAKYEKKLNELKNSRHKNMLAWMETHVVTLPDGRRVLHVFEVQSDVKQSFKAESVEQDALEYGTIDEIDEAAGYSASYIDSRGEFSYKSGFASQKEAQVFLDQKLAEYQQKVQPLIDHTDEILMKAALKLAKREGLDGVVVSDPRTAMLTQGHLGDVADARGQYYDMDGTGDQGISVRKQEPNQYNPPSQAAGMTQAYGEKLPNLLKRYTGKEPEAVVMGPEKHYAYGEGGVEGFDFENEGGASISEFNKAFPGSDSPSGAFFPVGELPNRPFEVLTPKMPEPPKPQVEAIEAAVDCLVRKML